MLETLVTGGYSVPDLIGFWGFLQKAPKAGKRSRGLLSSKHRGGFKFPFNKNKCGITYADISQHLYTHSYTHAGLGSAKFSTLGWDGFINVLVFFGLI